jgi:hypothetical protein
MHYQADPPVCTRCLQVITRSTFGCAYFVPDTRDLEPFEIIECIACTYLRDHGTALLDFVQRHQL